MPLTLTDKQNEYIRNAVNRWNFKVGAVRSGKSFVDVAFVVPYRLRQLRNKPGLNVILGVSKSTIERNVLQPMREIYGAQIATPINSNNVAYVCDVPVYCLGAEKISQVAKIQGASFKYCYGDEVAKWNKEVFAMLQGRLDKEYSCFDGSCNPESPGHWLKAFIDREDLDAYIQRYTLFDNPYLAPSFVDNLCKEYEGTVYYGRYINGEWTQAEGLIYPMYMEAIKEPPEVKAEKYMLSIDYGTQNAFAAILWGKYGEVWYAVSEYYYSGRETGVQKTDEEYGTDLSVWLTRFFAKYKNKNGEGGSVPWPLRTIIDPSAASFIVLLQKKRTNDEDQRKMFTVWQADNAVADGIRETATCMKLGFIKVSAELKAWKKEVQGYVWDDSQPEDKPVKIDDHEMDAMRYFVKTMQLANRRRRAAEV